MDKKSNAVATTITIILTCLTVVSLYYLSEAIAAHQELLREIKQNRELLEASQKALEEKMLELQQKQNVPVTKISNSWSWQSIAIGVGFGVVIIGLMGLGYYTFSPPTDPNIDGINEASKTLSLIHDQIADLGNRGESIAVDRAQSISLIEQRDESLSHLADELGPLVKNIRENMDQLDANNDDQIERLDDLLSYTVNVIVKFIKTLTKK